MTMLQKIVSALLMAALLPACATVTTGTTQGISVITDPPGATCELRRGGATVSVVNPTPGTANVSKSNQAIEMACSRPGTMAATRTITSEFQGMTAGNILLGGVIGLAVDAASGAMTQYPATVTLVMVPEHFATQTERDDFFARRIAEVQQGFAERITQARSNCGVGDGNCAGRVATIEAERDAALADLERQRLSARLG